MTNCFRLGAFRLTDFIVTATLSACCVALTACGGSNGDNPGSISGTDPLNAFLYTAREEPNVSPAYRLAPVAPGAPSEVDRNGSSASAFMPPRTVSFPNTVQNLPFRAASLPTSTDNRSGSSLTGSGTLILTPQASNPVTTYTPAQIRAAYGLPAVPSDLGKLTALQAAQLGAGQVIYIIAAYHDPYAFGELLAFSSLFGLPGCTQKTLESSSTLPLAPPTPNSTDCEFYQIASGAEGSIAETLPRYDESWATEIAMDIQWAHAIAPLARIALIEAANDNLPAVSSAIQLANRLGPGVVSMSFAGSEGGFVIDKAPLFQAAGMSYFASTGDNGAAVNWPAVSPTVVAVGGTSLRYSGSGGGSRSETAWSLTGGGISEFVDRPTYQNPSLLRNNAITRRSVADVSMNADPATGQFVAVIRNPLTCTFCQVSWITSGGTSLATPMWAGLAAVANALRVRSGKGLLGAPHAALYNALSSSTAYTSAFQDISVGSNGACSTCRTAIGYDGPSGLGTPKGLALVNLLADSSSAPTAPIVTASTINGAYGMPISFTPSVSSLNAYSLAISGGPSGMTLSEGVVRWPNPVSGKFSVKVTAKDLKSGLTGSGVYDLIVTPPPAPIVGSGSMTATVGQAFSVIVSVADRYPCKLSLIGAPTGMTITAGTYNSATVSWPIPKSGSYRFTVKAVDTQTGLSSQSDYTISVNPVSAPRVAAGQVAARPGVSLSTTVDVKSNGTYGLSLSGAPSGMMISATGELSWATPVAGNYSVTVQAKNDKTGLTGSSVINFNVGNNTGPAIFSTVMSGVAGKPFTGSLLMSDAGASLSGLALSGNHPGIKFDTSYGLSKAVVTWASPVTGNYTLLVSVTDSQGKSTIASVPLLITAQ